jgi:hypothetical protein
MGPALPRLFDRVEVEADVVDAAAGRPDDGGEGLEAVDEVRLGGRGILLATPVGHRLAAAGSIEGVFDRAAAPLAGRFLPHNHPDAFFFGKASAAGAVHGRMFQTTMVVSSLPETSRRPSGEKWTEVTAALWPEKVTRGFPRETDQSRIWPFSFPMAINLPS